MKEMGGTATAAIEAAIAAIQSAQMTWTNIATADAHCQAPGSDVGELHMVIPARHN